MTEYRIQWRECSDWHDWSYWFSERLDEAQLEEEVAALRRLWPRREWRLVRIEREDDEPKSI